MYGQVRVGTGRYEQVRVGTGRYGQVRIYGEKVRGSPKCRPQTPLGIQQSMVLPKEIGKPREWDHDLDVNIVVLM